MTDDKGGFVTGPEYLEESKHLTVLPSPVLSPNLFSDSSFYS